MSGTLRSWYEELIPPEAVHWEPVQLGPHGGSGKTTALIDQVTCPVCQLILQTTIADQNKPERELAWRACFRPGHVLSPVDQIRAANEAADRQRIREEAEVREAVRRTKHREARERFYARQSPEAEEQRERARDRRGYSDSESIKSRGRATHLTERQQALDAYPDVDWNDTWEAVNELRDDQHEDPAHWVNLRRFADRGELPF